MTRYYINHDPNIYSIYSRACLLYCVAIIFFLLNFHSSHGQNLNLDWVDSYGSNPGQSSAMSVVTDEVGNTYVTGFFYGNVDFDPGPDTVLLTNLSGHDVFFLKYNAEGKLKWAKQLHSTNANYMYGKDVAIDNLGYVYFMGSFQDTVDMNPGPGIDNAVATGNSGSIYVIKLDTSGNYYWFLSFEGKKSQSPFSLCSDKDGNVLVTGFFSDSTDFDPGIGKTVLTSKSKSDVFIAKYDSSGSFQWVTNFDKNSRGNNHLVALSLQTDQQGNIYTVGNFADTVDFDPGPNKRIGIANNGFDGFVTKFDPNGNLLWFKQLAGNNAIWPNSVDVDNSGVFITGEFFQTVDFDPGPMTKELTSTSGWDVFIVKLDLNGNFLWGKRYGNDNGETSRTVAINSIGNIFIGGHFADSIKFGSLPTLFVPNNRFNSGCKFLLELNSLGQEIWDIDSLVMSK